MVGRHTKWYQGKPLISALLLAVIPVMAALCCHAGQCHCDKRSRLIWIWRHYNEAPGARVSLWDGHDRGRRYFFHVSGMGARISLLIGVLATFISTVLAILYFGSVSGCAPLTWVDSLLMTL